MYDTSEAATELAMFLIRHERYRAVQGCRDVHNDNDNDLVTSSACGG